jgi:hypothetical protein
MAFASHVSISISSFAENQARENTAIWQQLQDIAHRNVANHTDALDAPSEPMARRRAFNVIGSAETLTNANQSWHFGVPVAFSLSSAASISHPRGRNYINAPVTCR